MSDYTSPEFSNISFSFSNGSYEPSNFAELRSNFNTKSSITSTANLQASIEVLQLYQDTTYTYVKECKTIVTGFYKGGIQTLKLPCSYGGIRDLGSLLLPVPQSLDLVAHLTALIDFTDLQVYFKQSTRSTKNLQVWYRQASASNIDLSIYVKFIKGVEEQFDLLAILKDIQPIDLKCLLNVIELVDIGAIINGVLKHESADITADFYKVLYRANKNLEVFTHGWQTKNLEANIRSFWYKDITANLMGGYFGISKNLGIFIRCITPKDLHAYLQGFAYKDLTARIVDGYTPNDLRAYVTDSIQPVDLLANIKAFKSVAKSYDLKVYIEGFYKNDLKAYINIIDSKYLKAYINATGKYLDLEALIYPRTINIKHVLFVPLFEHKDLSATINYNCMKSYFHDLSAYIAVKNHKDLKAHITGWLSGSADTIVDLAAFINVLDYRVENTINVMVQQHPKHSTLYEVNGNNRVQDYIVNNTITFVGGRVKDLTANIVGQFTHKDLAAKLKALPVANFTTVPEWVKPKSREVVLNLRRFEERWIRFVNLMFITNSEDDYHYFYVSGERKAYKVDKNRTWSINVIGYTEDTTKIYSREKINQKFIFNLKNYTTMDEAILDMIDRVSLPRNLDLTAQITCIEIPSKNLKALISIRSITTWAKELSVTLKGIGRGETNLESSIVSDQFKGINNLSALIVGKSYTPPPPNDVEFVFDPPGYTASPDYNNIEWTHKQAEEFWK